MGDAKTKRMSAESNRARRPSDNKLAGKLDYMILVNYSFGILVPNRRRYIGTIKRRPAHSAPANHYRKQMQAIANR